MSRKISLLQQNGSIVLETAVVLPFFAAFFFALSFLLTVAQTKLALRDAVDETVKTASAYAYPVDLIVHAYRGHPAAHQAETVIDRFLPAEIKMMLIWLREQQDQGMAPGNLPVWGMEVIAEGIAEAWLKPAVIFYADQTESGKKKIDSRRLKIRSVTLPEFRSEDGSYFGITAEYTVPIPVPFLGGEMILVESAYERCWVGSK